VNDVLVNSVDALHSLHSAHFVWQEGAYLEVRAEYLPVNDFRWVRLPVPPFREIHQLAMP
jgi:hypothetical protein